MDDDFDAWVALGAVLVPDARSRRASCAPCRASHGLPSSLARQRAIVAPRARMTHGRAGGSVGYVNDLQVNKLDAAIQALDHDIRAVQAEMDRPASPADLSDPTRNTDSSRSVLVAGRPLASLPGAARGDFHVAWTDFIVRWNSFLGGLGVEGHGWREWVMREAGTLSRALDDQEFAAWTSKYGQARRAWLEQLGQRTRAPAPGTAALSGPGGSSGDESASLPRWVYPVIGLAALVVLAPYLTPIIAAIASRHTATAAAAAV